MQTRNNYTESIESLIQKFENPLQSKLIKRKAGLWQGIEAYKDMEMFIMRDVTFVMDIPTSGSFQLCQMVCSDHPWGEIHFLERVGGEPLNPGESYKIWPYAKFNEEGDDFILRQR